MSRTFWTYRAYCDRRALIAERLNIRPEDVSFDQSLAYDAGEMEPAAACDWPPLPSPIIGSGPYRVVTMPAGVGAAYRAAATPFEDDWPAPLPTLLIEGSGGE